MNNTYEQAIIDFSNTEHTNAQSLSFANNMAYDIINEDSRLISVNRRWVSYGTWRITLFANEYHFGNVLAERMEKLSIITHNEEKEYTVDDFADDIEEVIYCMIDDEDWMND